jgi:non-heme chloroperoxidase
VKALEAIVQNWWRQGMMGAAKAHYDGIVAFSQTDFTDDLKKEDHSAGPGDAWRR